MGFGMNGRDTVAVTIVSIGLPTGVVTPSSSRFSVSRRSSGTVPHIHALNRRPGSVIQNGTKGEYNSRSADTREATGLWLRVRQGFLDLSREHFGVSATGDTDPVSLRAV